MSRLEIKPENNNARKYREIMDQYFSKSEIAAFHEKSDALASWYVFKVWFWLVFAFVLVGFYPHLLTILLAMFIIGAKQLGCAIIMHDASHYSLFNSKAMNDVIGNWFGAYPVVHNVQQYRPYHLQHHLATGTEDDPDINLTKGYPSGRKSMIRKFARDLAGLSGVKSYYGVFAMHLGYLRYNLGNYIERLAYKERGYLWRNGLKNLKGPIVANLIIFSTCWAIGQPLLYLLWPASLLTTNMLILRVRSMAEHSMVSNPQDPRQSARSIGANWFQKAIFAPLNVNFHLEHHLMFTIPSYHFPKMHARLKERGFYENANYSPGYYSIIRKAMSQKSN